MTTTMVTSGGRAKTKRGERGGCFGEGTATHWDRTAAATARQRRLGAEPGGGGTAQGAADAGGDDWRHGWPRQATGVAEGRRWALGRPGRVLPRRSGATERWPRVVEVASWLGRAQAAAGHVAARAEDKQGGGAASVRAAATSGVWSRRAAASLFTGRRRRGRHGDVGTMCQETRQAWERGALAGSGAAQRQASSAWAVGARATQAGRAWPRAVGASVGWRWSGLACWLNRERKKEEDKQEGGTRKKNREK
ncbi:hypothetical protein E2562_019572 [Oryza meyeriana var. granulata]|uniref:Uncharacterized protein n=1 Tax=Oryza meyeriana var. granulata TaxID=110450 RepID=A0A6G1BY26_9ORYZ|nr:hypothetical protein E2562_019572 [Oryza meyeriana var. granulata]